MMIPISFKKAKENSREFIVSPGCKTENKGYFSESRIDKSTIPDGWYVYEIRGSDYDYERPTTIENRVIVNFCGSFITQTPIKYSKGKDYFHLKRNGYKCDYEISINDQYKI